MVTAPAEPVLYSLEFPVAVVLQLELLGVQQPAGGYETKLMYIDGFIPHMGIQSGTKDINSLRNLRQNPPFWAFRAFGDPMGNIKPIGDRIAFSTHRAA